MQDSFNIHNWQLARQLSEYRQTLEPVPGPIQEDEIEILWNNLRNHTSIRADIIAAASPIASVHNKSFNWQDLKSKLRGLIVGYFNNHPKKYYYYEGISQSL